MTSLRFVFAGLFVFGAAACGGIVVIDDGGNTNGSGAGSQSGAGSGDYWSCERLCMYCEDQHHDACMKAACRTEKTAQDLGCVDELQVVWACIGASPGYMSCEGDCNESSINQDLSICLGPFG